MVRGGKIAIFADKDRPPPRTLPPPSFLDDMVSCALNLILRFLGYILEIPPAEDGTPHPIPPTPDVHITDTYSVHIYNTTKV